MRLEIISQATIVTAGLIGANWVAFTDSRKKAVECAQIAVFNATGEVLDFGYGNAGDTAPTGSMFLLAAGSSWTFRGLKLSTQLFVRGSAGSVARGIAEAL
jgi:hypothetical protein